MNQFYIFVVRLVLGVVLGIVIARIFKPDWGMFAGAAMGLGLVAGAYLMQSMRKQKPDPK
jgi:predicted MFS family arabinose efflux permease